ncbi:putative c1q-globular head like [uncultured Mediterranean phage uvMED]|nr:putative c1q-globular head like [uncultured Mediterranean phage uvMED]BAR17560.1 putative c1q-globular head like [uncultured Mediterranean phage uvMED]
MTVKINADTSDGLKFVSDTSGAIDFQSNGSTKMSMDASGNLTAVSFIGSGANLTNLPSSAPLIFHARDEKSQGTNGGDISVGDNDRDLNTVLTNTIPGASLSSNQITLPAGTYDVIAMALNHNGLANKIFFYNNTDSVSDIRGHNNRNGATDIWAVAKQRITITGTKVYRIIHYAANARSGYGGGLANSNGVEIYVDVHITKVA